MPRRTRTALGGLLALLVALPTPQTAVARAYQLDDLLATEWFGRTLVDPSGRWAVIERRDPFITAPRFDLDYRTEAALGRLLVADLAGQGEARPLLPRSEGPGLIAGAFSPSGRRLLVYRLRGDDWRLGVVSIPDGAVTWLDVTPEDPTLGRIAAWRSDEELVVLTRPDRSPPRLIRRQRIAPQEMPARWAATRDGKASATAYGSGAWRDVRPKAAPVSLTLVSVRDASHRELARGDFTELAAAPSGGPVAVLEAGEDIQPRADHALQMEYGFGNRRHALRLVSPRDGVVRPACAGQDIMERLMAWSPDGRRLVVQARAPGSRWDEGALKAVQAAGGCPDLATGAFRPQVLIRPDRVDAGWMGAMPIALGRVEGGPLRWFALDGAPRPLTPADAAAPSWSAVSAGQGLIVAGGDLLRVTSTGRSTVLARAVVPALPGRRNPNPAADLAPDTGAVPLLRDGPAGREAGVMGRGGRVRWRRLAGDSQVVGYSGPLDLVVVQTREASGIEAISVVDASGHARPLARINQRLADTTPPQVVPIHHKAPDGRPITSWLFLPERAPGSPPPPLIITPYLGEAYPQPYRRTPPMLEFTVHPRMMLAAGYAVLLPSLPRRRMDDAWREVAARMLAIVDQAAADPALQGAFDPDRLALWGLSFGGYTVAQAITQSDRFKAAIDCSGPIDPLQEWGVFQPEWRMAPEVGLSSELAMSWTEDSQLGLGGPPWKVPERYIAANPAFAADRIRTPLLIFASDQDPIGLEHGELMFSALYRQDKDAQLVTYWGEGHHVASPGNIRDRYARAFAFLERHLRPSPAAPPDAAP